MNHLFKQDSLQNTVKYNQKLLLMCIMLAIAVCLLAAKTFVSNERWVLIPANDIDKRLLVSSNGYSETYLREWAIYVVQTLMTTSNDTVEAQIEEIKAIASSSKELSNYFVKHKNFVKGSNIQSVFFPKKVEFDDNSVLVSGLFRYWLGSSEKPVSQEKTYRLSYKRGPKDILLLKGVKEEVSE